MTTPRKRPARQPDSGPPSLLAAWCRATGRDLPLVREQLRRQRDLARLQALRNNLAAEARDTAPVAEPLPDVVAVVRRLLVAEGDDLIRRILRRQLAEELAALRDLAGGRS